MTFNELVKFVRKRQAKIKKLRAEYKKRTNKDIVIAKDDLENWDPKELR